MNFREFTENVKIYVEENLPKEFENAEVKVMPVKKLNTSYLGMRLSGEGLTVVPTLNLNDLYQDYENRPEKLHRVLEQAIEVLCNNKLNISVQDLTDYEYVKDRLFIRVSNAEMNAGVLRSVPHHEEAGLAITYHILVSEEKDGIASAIINNDLFQRLEVSKEKLHEDAMKSAQILAPARVTTMQKVMAEMMLAEGVDPQFVRLMTEHMDQNPKGPLYVVTTKGISKEASALFYPAVMDDLAKKLGTDLLILPSSTNEVIVTADNGSLDIEELKDMVSMINETDVAPEERLADDVFHYDARERVFERAEDFTARQNERKSYQKESVLGKMMEKKEQAMDRASSKKSDSKDLGPVL